MFNRQLSYCLVHRLWLIVLGCGSNSSLISGDLQYYFGLLGLSGNDVVVIGPCWCCPRSQKRFPEAGEQVSLSGEEEPQPIGTISLPWPSGVVVGSLWLVLPSCLVSLDEEWEPQALREGELFPCDLLLVGFPIHPPYRWCWSHLVIQRNSITMGWEGRTSLAWMLLLDWKENACELLSSCIIFLVPGFQTSLPSSSHLPEFFFDCLLCYFQNLSLTLVWRSREKWVYASYLDLMLPPTMACWEKKGIWGETVSSWDPCSATNLYDLYDLRKCV